MGLIKISASTEWYLATAVTANKNCEGSRFSFAELVSDCAVPKGPRAAISLPTLTVLGTQKGESQKEVEIPMQKSG